MGWEYYGNGKGGASWHLASLTWRLDDLALPTISFDGLCRTQTISAFHENEKKRKRRKPPPLFLRALGCDFAKSGVESKVNGPERYSFRYRATALRRGRGDFPSKWNCYSQMPNSAGWVHCCIRLPCIQPRPKIMGTLSEYCQSTVPCTRTWPPPKLWPRNGGCRRRSTTIRLGCVSVMLRLRYLWLVYR